MPNDLIGDSGRLRQVLVNLAGNAIKFTANGEVVVDVERGTCFDQVVELRFRVTDTGIGIHPNQHATIFQPFRQADNSTTRLYGGTGLGLSIAAQLIDLMGGKIAIESEPGRGSTFRFTAQFAAAPVQERPLLPHRPSLCGACGPSSWMTMRSIAVFSVRS